MVQSRGCGTPVGRVLAVGATLLLPLVVVACATGTDIAWSNDSGSDHERDTDDASTDEGGSDAQGTRDAARDSSVRDATIDRDGPGSEVDAGPDATADAGQDGHADTGTDAADAALDAARDSGLDAGHDAGPEAGLDANVDAAGDGAVADAPADGPLDAPDELPLCYPAYRMMDCSGYLKGTRVSSTGHNWLCANGACANCSSFSQCAPGGANCPWGAVWTDEGPCR